MCDPGCPCLAFRVLMFWPVGDQCGPGQTLCPGTILMATAQPCPTPTPPCARLSLCVSSSPSAGCSVAVAPEPGLWKQCDSLAQVQTHMTGPQQPQNTAEHLLAYWLSVHTGRGSPGPQRRAGPDRGLHTRLRSPTPLPLAAPSHQSPSGWLSLDKPRPTRWLLTAVPQDGCSPAFGHREGVWEERDG